ncbi:putative Phospholipase [Aspergillus mulundensis]|uniref:Acyl-protein thioesterase 1 n=1 Tax=Aspergillus mulundensis TaxID=1810919 RepID=A0A3D8T5X6_9EURO|nr:putative Phospholipase [Aspergillus mulundensis]RDW93418.1 putative Phospholipase [Aspergillus mulundensis]
MPPASTPSPKSIGREYPTPLTIPPLTSHTHTLILLHGRGSNATLFGHEFLASTALASRLPTTKFIFPTAAKRRAILFNRTPIDQWFDNWSLDEPNYRSEIQIEGLQETAGFLRTLIEEEARVLEAANNLSRGDGYGRIVVGGLSQGCAASVFSMLGGFAGDTEPGQVDWRCLGGFVGMSGWLPFDGEISGLLKMQEGADPGDDDPFARDSDGAEPPVHVQTVNHVREILDLPPLSKGNNSEDALFVPHLTVPVFLGHGSADAKVSVKLGERMASILADGLGMDVTWKIYEEFGHWYKMPDEINDIVLFLKDNVGFHVEQA